MVVLFAGQIPKDPAYPEAIEDVFVAEPTLGRFALSDGASESFDSARWAKLLVAKFARDPEFGAEWLSEATSEYATSFDMSALSWSQQAAFDRGSFATLLGVHEDAEHYAIKLLVIGDSVAALCNGTELIETFPYDRPEQFQQRPELFSTNVAHNTCFGAQDFRSQHSRRWPIGSDVTPIVLCMTDALAEWALRSSDLGIPVWEMLIGIDEHSDFEALVTRERLAKTMRIDDTTLVRLAFVGLDKNELSNPGTI